MSIPKLKELTAEDIQTAFEMANTVISEWARVKSSTSQPEYRAYRERLSDAHRAVSTVWQDMKQQASSVKFIIDDLDRHDDLAKACYWEHKQ